MSYQRRRGTSYSKGAASEAFKDAQVSEYVNHLRDVATTFRRGARGQRDTFHEFVVQQLMPKIMDKNTDAQALRPRLSGNDQINKDARVQYMRIYRNLLAQTTAAILNDNWNHQTHPIITTASDNQKFQKITSKPLSGEAKLKALKAGLSNAISRWWMLNKGALEQELNASF